MVEVCSNFIATTFDDIIKLTVWNQCAVFFLGGGGSDHLKVKKYLF